MRQSPEYIRWEVFRKALSGSLTDKESSEFDVWLDSAPENRQYFIKAFEYHKRQENNIDQSVELQDRKEAWLSFKKHVAVKRKRKIYTVVSTAAALALLVSLVYFLTVDFKNRKDSAKMLAEEISINPGGSYAVLTIDNNESVYLEERDTVINLNETFAQIDVTSGNINYKAEVDKMKESVMNRLEIPHGGEYRVRLPDGSKLYINSETIVEYLTPFSNNSREIFVRGEVFVEVAKDTSRPFIVKTDDYKVHALGTSFNISSYSNDDNAITTLLTGSVEITDIEDHSSSRYVLEPDEQLVLNRLSNNTKICEVDADNVIAWTKGYFIFEDETLESIFRKLERWYEFDTFFFSEEAEGEFFTGKLPRFDNLQDILKIINKVSRAEIELNERTVVIE